MNRWEALAFSARPCDEGKHMSENKRDCHWWERDAHGASTFVSTLATADVTCYQITLASQEREAGQARAGRQH
jgi:hypothetical protein